MLIRVDGQYGEVEEKERGIEKERGGNGRILFPFGNLQTQELMARCQARSVGQAMCVGTQETGRLGGTRAIPQGGRREEYR